MPAALFPRSPAERLLVALLARRLAETATAAEIGFLHRLPVLATASDLEEFERQILRHRLLPLLFPTLSSLVSSGHVLIKAGDDKASERLTERLNRHLQAHRQRGILLTAELIRLSRLFREARLPFLSLKGPALGQIAFGSPLARSFEDLDLWIAPTDLPQALSLLRGEGFHPPPNHDHLPLERLMEVDSSLSLSHRERGITVELHWRLFATRYPSWPTLAESHTEREEVILSGAPIPVPGRIDHLLFLTVHGCKHGWERLSMIADIAGVLQTGVDLPAALRTAASRGCLRRMQLALALIETLGMGRLHCAKPRFGAAIPGCKRPLPASCGSGRFATPHLREMGNQRQVRHLVRESRRRLLEEYAGLWPNLSPHLFFWKTSDSLSQAALEAISTICRPTVRDDLDRFGNGGRLQLLFRRLARLLRGALGG